MKKDLDLYAAEPIPEEALSEITDLLQSADLFRYTADEGSPAAALESSFAEYLGVPYALSVNSCSSALFLSLRSLGLEAGARVLIPAFTFAAVPSSVVHAGCRPVLVNINEDLRLDINDFERKLTKDTGAVIISHMRGHTSDMDALLALCADRNVPVIEDAAHSLGTRWHGQKLGTLGQIGCFSFQSYKLINAGEGGMMVTSDPEIIARAIIMSGAYEQNWKKHPVVSEHFAHLQNTLPLYNVRMNNLSAVVAKSQIDKIDARADAGRRNHDFVAERLGESSLLRVPAALPGERRAPDSLQFCLEGVSRGADALRFVDEAAARGVPVSIFGLSRGNARAFWNWRFIEPQVDLGPTRAILERACDVRLPASLRQPQLEIIAEGLLGAADAVQRSLPPASADKADKDAASS